MGPTGGFFESLVGALFEAHFDTGLCHYFTLGARFGPSWWAFGEDETISRNKETISNPAITAPINIGDPISASDSLCFSLARVLPTSTLNQMFMDVRAMRNKTGSETAAAHRATL